LNLLGVAGVDNAKIARRIAPFPENNLQEISKKLARILGFDLPSPPSSRPALP
jgi:hypothetical protein